MITPEERQERLEEMAVAMIALVAVLASQRLVGFEQPPEGSEDRALGFGLLLRPDVAALFSAEEFAAIFQRLDTRMKAHAAAFACA